MYTNLIREQQLKHTHETQTTTKNKMHLSRKAPKAHSPFEFKLTPTMCRSYGLFELYTKLMRKNEQITQFANTCAPNQTDIKFNK